jgi:hypothetical protein
MRVHILCVWWWWCWIENFLKMSSQNLNFHRKILEFLKILIRRHCFIIVLNLLISCWIFSSILSIFFPPSNTLHDRRKRECRVYRRRLFRIFIGTENKLGEKSFSEIDFNLLCSVSQHSTFSKYSWFEGMRKMKLSFTGMFCEHWRNDFPSFLSC